MAYHLMDWDRDNEELADIDVYPATRVPWTMGVSYDRPVPTPLVMSLDPALGKILPDAFFSGIPLFSRKLLDALSDAGVTNVRGYDAEIRDPRDGTTHLQYKAVLILGAIECADLEKSGVAPGFEPPLMEFDHLVIDEKRTHGLPFFRLAERARFILVHERVKTLLDRAKLIGVTWKPIASS